MNVTGAEYSQKSINIPSAPMTGIVVIYKSHCNCMCRMLRHNPKQSHRCEERCATFSSTPPVALASWRKLSVILITNKTIAATKTQRRLWLHNHTLWAQRQVNPTSHPVTVTISEQADNDKVFFFFAYMDHNCWCHRGRESTEWKNKPLTSLMVPGYDLGGDRYISEPVDIKVCADEMKAQLTEWCEANFALAQPACWSHTHTQIYAATPLPLQRQSSIAICQGYRGLGKPATQYASQHKKKKNTNVSQGQINILLNQAVRGLN